jgi:hypothetical protein
MKPNDWTGLALTWLDWTHSVRRDPKSYDVKKPSSIQFFKDCRSYNFEQNFQEKSTGSSCTSVILGISRFLPSQESESTSALRTRNGLCPTVFSITLNCLLIIWIKLKLMRGSGAVILLVYACGRYVVPWIFFLPLFLCHNLTALRHHRQLKIHYLKLRYSALSDAI